MEWNTLATSNESVELTGLNPETTYVVKVQSHCGQGNDSEMSDEIAFITRLFECPVPTDLTVGDVTHNTVDLNWNGESDSYKVMYRAKSQVQGSLQGFPSTTIPSGWSQKSGLLEEILSGQSSLTNASSWEFGEGGNVFDSHAKLNYVEGVHDWLISPPVTVADNYVLNFDLAMSMYAYCAPWDLFAVLVQDVESGQWSLLRQWDNQGSAYVLQDISHTGENVSVDLNAYTGKDVRIAFYGERIEYFWNIQIHVDNVCVVVPVTASDWQTAVDNHPNTNYTLTGLDPETSYEVKVGGVCGTTQSHEMSTVSFITSPYIQEPTNVYLSDIDYFSANLGWTENGTSTAWQIQLDDEPPMTVNTNPYTLTGLTPDTDYVVKVRSLQGGYFSNWSVATNFTTPFYCYPPTQLAVTEGTLNSATLGWTDHGTATQWQVCINGDETHLVTVNTTHYVMTNLDAQTQYTVKVRAICGETYTEWTDELSFVPVLYCNPPTLTVNNITTSTADLSWTAITGTDSYTVNITTPVVQSTCPIITGYTATGGTAGVNTNQSYPKLVDNDKSTKWCASLDNGIYIEFHSEMEFIPTAYILTTGNDNSSYHGRNPKNWVIKAKLNASDSWTTIATVTNDNVLQDENNTDYEFTLNNTNAYRYFRFEVSAVQSGNAFQLSELRFRGQVTSFNVTDTSMPLTDLLPETDYAAKVRGNIGEMLTNWSNEVNFTTCYLPPTNLTATPKTYSSVTLSWTANSNAPEWQICLNDDENNLIDASTNPFVLTGLTQQTQYAVKVRASHNGTISDWSGNVNFTTLPYCPAPTDLSALNVTCNSMMLSWNQNGTVSNWQICLNNDESNLITTNANPYSLTGLSAQTTYSVKVRGRLGGENYSDWSESINVTTTAFYQEPTDLAATEIHSNCAVLNWTENSNANEWRICLNNDMANLMTVNTRPFTLTGLTPESTYTVKVSAYHEGSFSGWSDPISFTTLVLTPSLTVSNVNVHSADLNWTNTSGASYTVRYNQVPSVMETLIFNGFEGGGIGWSFGYFGTSMPATSAVNNAHTGSWGLKFVASSACTSQLIVSPSFEDCQSLEFYYKTENTNETFQILFYVGNTNQSSTDEITVNSHGQWQKYTCDIPEGTTGLRIKYCGQSESALVIDDIRIFADHLEVASNTNSTQLTSLVYYKTYSAKVRTKHGGIYSEWSDAVEFTTYLPPTSVTVSDIAETEATVSWNENGDATQWQICLNNDQNNLIDVSTNPFTLTGLTQETHYTVKIRDCHELYNSAWCDAVEFTTLAYCTAPTDLAVDDILRHSATLSWNADSDTYKVFYRTTGDWILAAENISENTFILTGLDAETHYEACVKGVCNGIESNASDIIGFTTLLDSTPTMSVSDITYTSAGLLWTETPGADSYMLLFNNSEEILVTDRYTATEGTQGNDGENYPNLVDNNRNSKWFVNRNDGNGHFAGCYIEFHSQHVFIPTGYVLTTAYDTDNNGNHPGRNPKSWVIKAKLNAEDEWTTIESVTNNNVMQSVPLTDYTFTINNRTPYRYFRFEVSDVKSGYRFQLGEMKFLGYSKNSICITDLEPATTYTAKVRAKAGNLYSEWSDEFSFSTHFGQIAPTLTVSNVGSTSADLSWSENTDAIGYDISLNDEIVSFPSQIITGYTATSGSGGYNSNEHHTKLVDNDRTTKWCRQMNNNIYIEFHSESNFVPTGYILTTGANSATATGCNPKNWVIKAKLNEGDAWTTIATVTNDNVMQDVNTTDFEFAIDNHSLYRYFRFEVSANHGNNSFQLGEFRFLGYVPTNSLHLTNLQPETDYSVKVRSNLGEVYSEWSNTVDFTTLILPPTNLAVTNIDYYSATLGWDANSNVNHWQICLNGDEEHLILTDANPYTLTNLTHHTHYTVKVRNHQEGADDTWSDEIDFTTLFNIETPTLAVTDISQTSALLSWTEISGADGYNVSVNDIILPDQIFAGFTATSGASGYNNEGYANLVDNNRSTKWCRSKDNVYIEFNSESSFIPTGYILTTGTDNATAHGRNPKNWVIKAKLNPGDSWTTIVTVTNDNVLQDVNTTDFEFDIDNHLPYQYFRFEVSAVQNGGTFQLGELRFRGMMTSHSRMLTDLTPETEYNVKVRAYSGETLSGWSNVVNFTTLHQCDAPTNMAVANITHNSAVLSWDGDSDHYKVMYRTTGDWITATDNCGNTTYTFSGLNDGTQYEVCVKGVCDNIESVASGIVSFITPLSVNPPTIVVNNITRNSAVIGWTATQGADGYTLSMDGSTIENTIHVIEGYTATAGTAGVNSGQSYGKLVDNNIYSKWCVGSFDGAYIEFYSDFAFIPKGYILTTGNDNDIYHGRNPESWVIKAKLNADDAWTTIVTVTDDDELQDYGAYDFEFDINNNNVYRYFRFEVSEVENGNVLQLGELRFKGIMPPTEMYLADLLPDNTYTVKVRSNFGTLHSEWSDEVSFTTTFDGITFFANGNWNDAAKWNINRVPDADDNVNIAAQVIVPAGYTAQVKRANVNDGGSITIEDGGQFMADNTVKVTMQKDITKTSHWGFVGNYKPDNWYFLASPVDTEGSDFGVTGIITEGEGHDYDLYRLNVNTWENYKAEGVMYHFGLETGRGYLYASENGTEIEFNGNAMPYSETAIPLSDGFNLVGNPYTFNTYINRPYYKLNSSRTDIELVNDNTVIAPCEGVLIDVEGTDEVTFTKTSQMSQATNNGNLSITMTQQGSSRGAAASDKAIVSFNEGRQLGKFYFTQQDANIYIPRDGKDYAIVYSDRNGEIPLHFKATKIGRYTINFSGTSLRGIRLIDQIENVIIDLSAKNEYTFIGAPHDRKDRFVLLFDPSTGSGNDGYGAFAYQNGSDIIVSGNGELKVFDVMGRVVAIQQINGVETLRTSLQTGVYVFILDGKMQKIVVR